MKKGLQIFPPASKCVSEYTFVIAYTMLCIALNKMILPVWTPISGWLWWYSFYKIFLKMPMDDHSLKYSAIPIRDINMNFSCHKTENKTHTRTGIAFQGHHAQNQCQLASIWSITEEIVRNKSTLTWHFHRTSLQREWTKAWTTSELNIPMLVSFTHVILYWHLCGCAWDIEY